MALRKNSSLVYANIVQRIGMSISTVVRLYKQAGVAHMHNPKEPAYYEKDYAGEVLHLDIKKFARFHKPGLRVTDANQTMNLKAGYEALHVAID